MARPLIATNAWTKLSYWTPVVAWVATITYFSSIPDPYGRFRDQATTLTDLLAHTGGFIILMLLVGRLVRFLTGQPRLGPLLWGLIACLVYGAIDEFHQHFIPGRGVELIDLAANGVGALVGALIIHAYWAFTAQSGSAA
ncbi:MAG: VanZ family protein [Candidatus Zipacnadales bacterium]